MIYADAILTWIIIGLSGLLIAVVVADLILYGWPR